MTDSNVEHEYGRILHKHGRRVANRWLVATLNVAASGRSSCDFYAHYGSEANLPEHERGQTDLIHRFDPTGFLALYEHDCANVPQHLLPAFTPAQRAAIAHADTADTAAAIHLPTMH